VRSASGIDLGTSGRSTRAAEALLDLLWRDQERLKLHHNLYEQASACTGNNKVRDSFRKAATSARISHTNARNLKRTRPPRPVGPLGAASATTASADAMDTENLPWPR